MEHYTVLKGNEVLIHAMPSMNLESIKRSEISQIQIDNYCMISLIMKYLEQANFIETESMLEATGPGRRGRWGVAV